MSEYTIEGIYANVPFRVLYRPKHITLFAWLRMVNRFQSEIVNE